MLRATSEWASSCTRTPRKKPEGDNDCQEIRAYIPQVMSDVSIGTEKISLSISAVICNLASDDPGKERNNQDEGVVDQDRNPKQAPDPKRSVHNKGLSF
ncbi:MAG: hypothetical protein M0C28_47370 [Candidatus Moduliflexus flocculans]|nr:hypothetical protein [Candidatus Moduliflexus flocculans]